MDEGNKKQVEKKRDGTTSGMPSLDDVKNVSPAESTPYYRSMTMSAGPSVSTFASSTLLGGKAPLTMEKLGNNKEDIVLRQTYTSPKTFEQVPIHNPIRSILPFASAPKSEFRPMTIKTSWANPQVRAIPNYYPMERSNRILDDHEHALEEITANLSECFRMLGIQAKYLENPAGAALLTPELVEIHLYFWKTGGGKQICVEVQRRRGDSVTFHRYARHILEAASGDFIAAEYRDYSDSHYLKAAEKLLRTEISRSAEERQEALDSMEIAADLIGKDRLDARMLGMESLCILTNPRKTTLNTALLVSRAVLLGSCGGVEGRRFEAVHQFVLNVVQKRSMGDEDSVLEGMVVEYDSDDEDFFEDDTQKRDATKPPEYYDAMKAFVNYGFTILANAWEVLTTFESFESEPETTTVNLHSAEAVAAQFDKISYDYTDTDFFTSLLTEIGRAESKAHNACLAAKCLRILCQCSENAKLRSLNLGGLEIATRALEIGKAANARLERECVQLIGVMST